MYYTELTDQLWSAKGRAEGATHKFTVGPDTPHPTPDLEKSTPIAAWPDGQTQKTIAHLSSTLSN